MSAPPPATPAELAAGVAAPTELLTFDDVRRLCVALQEPERMAFTGEPSEIAEQRAAHARERMATLSRMYRVEVPSKGFTFGHYRTGQDEVELDGDRPLQAVENALALDLAGIDDVAFKCTPAQQAEWSRLKKAGALRLVVTFKPSGDRCPGSLHARAFRLSGVPTSWRMVNRERDPEKLLAAADEEGLPMEPSGKAPAEVAAPRSVRVTRVTLEGEAEEGRARLENVQGALDKCAGSARRPGSVVVAFALLGGRLTEPQVILDASRDETVSGCLARALAGAPVAGAGNAIGRGTLTLSVQ